MPYILRLKFPDVNQPGGESVLAAGALSMTLDVQDATFTVTPADPELEITQTTPWDGASGMQRDYYNRGATMAWRNTGGDWIDAAGVAQGTTGFDLGGAVTQLKTGTGQFSVDVTSMQTHWEDEAQIVLRATAGVCSLALRRNVNVDYRPRMTLLDASGESHVIEASASTVINLSTTNAQDGEKTSWQKNGADNAIFAFRLPANATRPFTNVLLWLYVTYSYSGGIRFAAHRLNPCFLFSGGTPTLGLAAGYTRDSGIEAHADVYFAGPVDSDTMDKYFGGYGLGDSETVNDVQIGDDVLESTYLVGKYTCFATQHRWSTIASAATDVKTNPDNGLVLRSLTVRPPAGAGWTETHQNTPEEMYFRYYIKFGADYNCTTEGKKLPGMSGRYGYWIDNYPYGYYEPIAAQGGSATNGKWNPVRGVIPAGWEGWSFRGHCDSKPTDDNPLKEYIFPRMYDYTPENGSTAFGVPRRWGNNTTGWTVFAADRWYCIEQYVKMNSVDVSSADQYGNGQGNPDGEYRVWIDGVQCYEKTGYIIRHHPSIKIDEVWLDHYHGGTVPAETPHSFRWTGLVAAKSYIGPMNFAPPTEVSPAWFESIAPNTWAQIPGTAINDATLAEKASHLQGYPNSSEHLGPTGANIGFGVWGGQLGNYSGGTLRRNSSELLIYGGGGPASGYGGNDVLGINLELDAPRWKCRINSTHVSNINTSGSPEFNPDGTPCAPHSYWQPMFDNDADRFYIFGAQNTWPEDQGYVYNGVKSNHINMGPLAWAVVRDGYDASHLPIPSGRAIDSSMQFQCNVGTYAGRVYCWTAHVLWEYTFATGQWRRVWTNNGYNWDACLSGIFPNDDVIWRLSSSNDSIRTIPLDGTGTYDDGTAPLVNNTGTALSFIRQRRYAGLAYDEVNDRHIIFTDDQKMYQLTYDKPTNTYTLDEMSIAGTPPPYGDSGGAAGVSGVGVALWGRFQYVPRLHGVVWASGRSKNLWFVRLT